MRIVDMVCCYGNGEIRLLTLQSYPSPKIFQKIYDIEYTLLQICQINYLLSINVITSFCLFGLLLLLLILFFLQKSSTLVVEGVEFLLQYILLDSRNLTVPDPGASSYIHTFLAQ